MLKHLHIKHFALISELDLEFAADLTVITGETGAGKSIIVDALEVVLGGRAEDSLIQIGHDRCEITASFDLDVLHEAKKWLLERELNHEEQQECLIRRTISRGGRSRSTINGTPCSIQHIRELRDLIIHIHSQNQHSLLLKNHYQAELLDRFAQHPALLAAVLQAFTVWRQINQELSVLQNSSQDHSAHVQLLNFQIQELDELNLHEGELTQLEAEHQKLSHAAQWIAASQRIVSLLAEEEQCAVLKNLYAASQQLKNLSQASDFLQINALLGESMVQVNEVVAQVRRYANSLELDPERLQQLDQRLSRIYELARKYRVEPQELHAKLPQLKAELTQWMSKDARISLLQQNRTNCVAEYTVCAQQLRESRERAAQLLNQLVTAEIRKLGMAEGVFQVNFLPREHDVLHAHGNESVEFLVSANPGQPLQPLNKVASGGELSRISLAIQLITVNSSLRASPPSLRASPPSLRASPPSLRASPPSLRAKRSNPQRPYSTLIFDEVDVGVGGKTAEIVGQQLRKLGENAQVFCVTHLPQVAAQGKQHLYVEKQVVSGVTEIAIRVLDKNAKIQEIARMLGGVRVTDKTREHAEEMLSASSNAS